MYEGEETVVGFGWQGVQTEIAWSFESSGAAATAANETGSFLGMAGVGAAGAEIVSCRAGTSGTVTSSCAWGTTSGESDESAGVGTVSGEGPRVLDASLRGGAAEART